MRLDADLNVDSHMPSKLPCRHSNCSAARVPVAASLTYPRPIIHIAIREDTQMKFRVAALALACAIMSLPAYAQGPGGPPPNYRELASQVANLQDRLAKLEGNITAADVAGTYTALVLETGMTGFHAGTPPHNATIETSALRGTLTLNVDGTGSTSFTGCEGSMLTPGTGAMTGLDCSQSENTNVTWTYAAGVVTITFLNDGDQIPLNVALGGRLLTVGFSPFHPGDPSSDHVLFILTRLR